MDHARAEELDRIRKLLEPEPRLVEERVSSEVPWEGRIFSVEYAEVRDAFGAVEPRELVHHHGGCGVAAFRDGRLCLVRQYRVALGRMTLEIPAGKVDAGEDFAVCAARELAEETGLVADSLEFVASSAGAPGFNDERTRVFFAHGLREGEAHPDADEYVDVLWLPLEDVLAAIKAGLIEDAKTIVAALAIASGMVGE